MKLDLRQDFKTIYEYVEQRVRDYPVYVNAGPGKDEAPIALMTLGFQMDQAGWVALVFDTRPKAEFDGEWQSHIEQNAIEFNHWFEAFDELSEGRSKLAVTRHDGSKKTLGKEADGDVLAECFGTLLRDVLIAARDKGVLKPLPRTKDCKLGVEDHDGLFGWCVHWNGKTVDMGFDEDALMQQLRSQAAQLSKAQQIEYWLGQLDLLAGGKKCDVTPLLRRDEFAVDELAKAGKSVVVPMLEFASKWASEPEFNGDRTGTNADRTSKWANEPEFNGDGKKPTELPMKFVILRVLWKLQKMKVVNPQVESLLCEILRKSVLVNEKRTLWGSLPHHAARTLHMLFKGYPEPEIGTTNNKLKNATSFIPNR